MIRVFFQPDTSADADVTQLSNLALADLKRLPPGTLPPVVLKSDASSLPVCLVAVSGVGLTETQLHDYAQFAIRNQIVTVIGRLNSRRRSEASTGRSWCASTRTSCFRQPQASWTWCMPSTIRI